MQHYSLLKIECGKILSQAPSPRHPSKPSPSPNKAARAGAAVAEAFGRAIEWRWFGFGGGVDERVLFAIVGGAKVEMITKQPISVRTALCILLEII